MTTRNDIRNIAIIAHVDHGKTTLVDGMLRQSGTFRQNQQVAERVMDSGDLERERGITILAKNTAIHWKGVKINIVDTPGHADFSGEVERVLKMVDGVMLLVDAFEGPMPQTRFVLRKALELKLPVLVCINKVDRPDARCEEVVDEVLDLLIELDAPEEQLDRPILYASARQGTATLDWKQPGRDLTPLLDAIVAHIPAPAGDAEGPAQVLISTIDYSEYVGRIGIGRVERGTLTAGMQAVKCAYGEEGATPPARLAGLYTFDGLKRVEVESVGMGDIVALSGIGAINIGDTVCDPSCPEPLPFVRISEPTVRMAFSVNDSPFAGREGDYVTSRHLRARLMRELQTDVSLRVEESASPDTFLVSGRGELHLSILIETMRRQGYELQVSKPEVLMRDIDGQRCEPMERMVADVPQAYAGAVIEKIGRRRGVLEHMSGAERVRLEFLVPSRGLFGYRSEFMTDTRGEGIMSAVFEGYAPYKGDLPMRTVGALVAFETGEATSYGLYGAQDRGTLFIGPGMAVYAGMIVGASSRPGDIDVNVCRKKHVTNTRNAASAEDSLRLVSVKALSLEECLEFIADDELLEVTPKSLRMRKRVLSHEQRMKLASRKAR
ncbi:MAG: translational GTPase TypA [Christensenellales bacterium]|uniref:Large ribosomal subunit assembly factor BipA n=1 Tax=Candidatus Avichristensenella intestinipullorum TaxID=2840693 RepID=A0A9D1CKH6_9FIRM|nr:translational GTPase TypA [Christensenellales bacterium]HIQ63724.1 translational GTPase TypA [Candidatus Avichristensenella intestinipullorum]